MIKHTQTIRQQQPTNCLSVFDHFVSVWQDPKYISFHRMFCVLGIIHLVRAQIFPKN